MSFAKSLKIPKYLFSFKNLIEIENFDFDELYLKIIFRIKNCLSQIFIKLRTKLLIFDFKYFSVHLKLF